MFCADFRRSLTRKRRRVIFTRVSVRSPPVGGGVCFGGAGAAFSRAAAFAAFDAAATAFSAGIAGDAVRDCASLVWSDPPPSDDGFDGGSRAMMSSGADPLGPHFGAHAAGVGAGERVLFGGVGGRDVAVAAPTGGGPGGSGGASTAVFTSLLQFPIRSSLRRPPPPRSAADDESDASDRSERLPHESRRSCRGFPPFPPC